MKSIALLSSLALLAPAVAFAQGPMPAPPTAEYMMKAGQSDQFEIQEGQLAADNGSSSKIKHFGKEMVKDHTKSTKLVMKAAAKSGMTPPDAPPPLDADQQQMLTSLQATSGKDFDKTYITQQLAAHQKALALQESYAASGSDPHFQMAAKKIVPVVKKHLAMLQSMSAM